MWRLGEHFRHFFESFLICFCGAQCCLVGDRQCSRKLLMPCWGYVWSGLWYSRKVSKKYLCECQDARFPSRTLHCNKMSSVTNVTSAASVPAMGLWTSSLGFWRRHVSSPIQSIGLCILWTWRRYSLVSLGVSFGGCFRSVGYWVCIYGLFSPCTNRARLWSRLPEVNKFNSRWELCSVKCALYHQFCS